VETSTLSSISNFAHYDGFDDVT